MANLIDNLQESAVDLVKRLRQVLLYGVIGFSALGLELAVFYVLTQSFGLGIWLGNAFGMLVGLVFGFTLNARYNFQVYDRRLERFLRYGLVAFGGYLLTTSLIFGLTTFTDLAPFTAKLLSLPPYFFFQYNVNRLFTFQSGGTSRGVPVEAVES